MFLFKTGLWVPSGDVSPVTLPLHSKHLEVRTMEFGLVVEAGQCGLFLTPAPTACCVPTVSCKVVLCRTPLEDRISTERLRIQNNIFYINRFVLLVSLILGPVSISTRNHEDRSSGSV